MADTIATLPTKPVFFDEATALKLSQVFAQQDRLEELMRLLFVQMRATCATTGLHFANPAQNIDMAFGQTRGHHAEYNLKFRDEVIGTLTRYFARPQSEPDLQTGEDLIGLAMLAIRNAVKLYDLHKPVAAQEKELADHLSTDEKLALAEVASVTADPDAAQTKSDTLVLVSLDDYPTIVERDGADWADILMTSVHQQLTTGLRSADGAYHIGDDLIAVLLPRTTGNQALQVAQKIRVLIASLHLRGDAVKNQLTASMGISSSSNARTAEDVMANAKIALAQARVSGANQIKLFDPNEERNAG
ncbi:MAG: diguanylate cyclase [Pseudomonadota bacterium]